MSIVTRSLDWIKITSECVWILVIALSRPWAAVCKSNNKRCWILDCQRSVAYTLRVASLVCKKSSFKICFRKSRLFHGGNGKDNSNAKRSTHWAVVTCVIIPALLLPRGKIRTLNFTPEFFCLLTLYRMWNDIILAQSVISVLVIEEVLLGSNFLLYHKQMY